MVAMNYIDVWISPEKWRQVVTLPPSDGAVSEGILSARLSELSTIGPPVSSF
jgi:hypothetical protein